MTDAPIQVGPRRSKRRAGVAVLLAGGDMDTRRTAAELLGAWGYGVLEFGCDLDLLKALSHGSAPADRGRTSRLVVLDISHDFAAGLSLLEAIRCEDWVVPVLVIADRKDARINAACARFDVADVLTSPLDLALLLEAVSSIAPARASADR